MNFHKNKFKNNTTDNYKSSEQKIKPIKVTIISQYFPPDFAATGQLLNELTRSLAKKNIKTLILTGLPAYAYKFCNAKKLEISENICIRRTSLSRFWPERIRGRAINGILFCLRISIRLIKKSRRGDLLVFTTEPPYLPMLGLIVKFLTGSPYIVILYDLYPDLLTGLSVLKKKNWLVRLWNKINQYVFTNSEEIIVLSDSMRKRIVSNHKNIESKVSVITSWADSENIYPIDKKNNWFAKKNIISNTFNVLYSGNQGRCHDLTTLIGAALIMKEEKDINFIFIGGGFQNERIKKLAKELNLKNCKFLPYQEYEDLRYTIGCGDIGVVTLGIGTEGLVAPSKLYAHLAAGSPIAAITPDNSYLKTTIENNKFGKWFNNGDSSGLSEWIIDLKKDRTSYTKTSQIARNYLIKNASRKIITEKYLELIKKAVDKSK